MKSAAVEVLSGPYRSVLARDRFARQWCVAAKDERSLNGVAATALDASQAYELGLAGGRACRDALRFGPSSRPVVGLPEIVVKTLGLRAEAGSGAFVWVLPRRVLWPEQPLPISTSRSYPPRRAEWEASRGRPPEVFRFSASAREAIVVAPLNALHPDWRVRASANGVAVSSAVSAIGLAIFLPPAGGQLIDWQIEVGGVLPELTNIVTVDLGATGESLPALKE
ncbi:MAG: hypothetical protein N3F11_08305 [Casimicrobiaceae bacterium]|nr:hypothetical protein [Casimicrobiaceae bacterium]MDW8313091.1 hypothetical protein [Burkholderiales bacterium]